MDSTCAQNKAIIRRYVDELNERNMAVLDELVAQDVVLAPLVSGEGTEAETEAGREAYRAGIASRIAAFPDYHVTIHEMIAEVMTESDQIAARAPLITSLMSMAVGMSNHKAIGHVLEAVTTKPPGGFAKWQYEAMAKLLDGLGQRDLSFGKLSAQSSPDLARVMDQADEMFKAARDVVADEDAAVADRTVALSILGRGPNGHARRAGGH